MKTIENQEFEKVTIKNNYEHVKCLIGFADFISATKAAEWLGDRWSVRLIKRKHNQQWEDHGVTYGPIQVTSDLYGDDYKEFSPDDTLIYEEIKDALESIIYKKTNNVRDLINVMRSYINEQSDLIDYYDSKCPEEVMITRDGHLYETTTHKKMRHISPDGDEVAVALVASEEIFDEEIDNDNDLFAAKITAENADEIISTNSVVYCYNADTQFIDTEEEREELINAIEKYGVKELTGSDLEDAYIKLGIPDCFDTPCYATTGYDCVNAIFAIIY